MKLNHYIYSLIAGLVLMLSACSPDEYDMGKKTYVSDDLAEGIAYTVTIAGNQVRLKSNITGCLRCGLLLRDVRKKVNLPLNCLSQVRMR